MDMVNFIRYHKFVFSDDTSITDHKILLFNSCHHKQSITGHQILLKKSEDSITESITDHKILLIYFVYSPIFCSKNKAAYQIIVYHKILLILFDP